jgi:hypothetical protein
MFLNRTDADLTAPRMGSVLASNSHERNHDFPRCEMITRIAQNETLTSLQRQSFSPNSIGVFNSSQLPCDYVSSDHDDRSFMIAPVSDGTIQELMSWAGSDVDLITLQPPLRPGDLVEINDGAMRRMNGAILRKTDDCNRVAVLLSMLEYQAQLTISRIQLARVG